MCKHWELFTFQLNCLSHIHSTAFPHTATHLFPQSKGRARGGELMGKYSENQLFVNMIWQHRRFRVHHRSTSASLPVTRVASFCRAAIRACRFNALLSVTCGLILLHEERHADKPASVCLLRKVLESPGHAVSCSLFF